MMTAIHESTLLERVLEAVSGPWPRLGSRTVRARRDRARALAVLTGTTSEEPADSALAEHLAATLEMPGALGADSSIIVAVELTLAYHEAMICEPAALAQALDRRSTADAVHGHLRVCRRCRAEFAARVVRVLSQAGELSGR